MYGPGADSRYCAAARVAGQVNFTVPGLSARFGAQWRTNS